MILGVGLDLVEIARMNRALGSSWAQRFIGRVFSDFEIRVCEKAANRSEAYASRFAAKEALVKALGTGFSQGIQPGQIWVKGTEKQRPLIELEGAAKEFALRNGVRSIHVSLTHSRLTAGAVVILEGA